jgi:hypothetical protein
VTTTTAVEPTRRDFLYIATGTVGAVGAAAVAWPLISQMNPDASTIAAGAPIEVDLAPVAEGQVIKVFWRSKPIFISHRSKKEIEEAQKVDPKTLPDPQPDSARVKQGHDQWLVLIGSAASRSRTRASTMVSSAPATARSTTPRAASGAGPRPPTSPYRRTSSFPTPRSASADLTQSTSRTE